MAQRQNQLNQEITHLYSLYEKGIDYQNSIGLSQSIETNIRFFEGNQWPQPTESTKNLPRPVINIVKMICRSKKAAILSTPVKLIFKSYTQGINTERFNSFANSILKELGQDSLDKQALDDGIKKGSYFFHYYWDKNAIDLNGIVDGGVRCELINPLNIFFANPTLRDEQKQGWILIASHLTVDEILTLCDENVKITASLLENDKNDNGTVTLLTRYFRINGEVYCERATKRHIISAPFPIAPSSPLTNSQNIRRVRAGLYPIVAGCYERRESSIYGLSEIDNVIPNQKAINFNVAMSLLNAQECAWGKYVALPNALKGQKISNVPGQVLIDHSGTGNGIKKMSEQPLSQVPMEITSKLIDMTKSVSGASGIMSGEVEWSNMSGTAIAQLQAQAQVPLEELRSELWEAKRKQGLVIAQFMKLYYYKKPFITKIQENEQEKEIFDYFTSSDYENSIFDVSVEVTGGSKLTTASVISMLDTCLKNGSISAEAYVKSYPDSLLINKTEILKHLQLEKAKTDNK